MKKRTRAIIVILLIILVATIIIRKNQTVSNNADIFTNESKITEELANASKSPLELLLSNGLPTVLDFGSNTCIPCKMMKPIFAELEVELADKANLLIINITEYRTLADKYEVRVIPTQIFFDSEGKQYWRHEGFLAKEDIIKKLEESGSEL